MLSKAVPGAHTISLRVSSCGLSGVHGGISPAQPAAQIANADKLEASTRQLAAEFLITLCEAREKAPGMMRKLPNFLGAFFDCLMGFLMDIEVQPCLTPL